MPDADGNYPSCDELSMVGLPEDTEVQHVFEKTGESLFA